MPAAPGDPSRPTVFISFAHDPERPEARTRVYELADYLDGVGCEVLTERQYGLEAPTEGWTSWMSAGIERADFVLVVGSARYVQAISEEPEPGGGRGVAWEWKLIKTFLWGDQGHGKKVIGILRDGGDPDEIPRRLRDSLPPKHRFPSQRGSIAEWITGKSGLAALDRAKLELPPQAKYTIGLLAKPACESFRDDLIVAWRQLDPGPPEGSSAEGIVKWLLASEDVQARMTKYLSALRRAHKLARSAGSTDRGTLDDCVIALYCLCLGSQVDSGFCQAGQQGVTELPETEDEFAKVVCGLLAIELLGGIIRWCANGNHPLPDSEQVIELETYDQEDWSLTVLEARLYARLFPTEPGIQQLVESRASLSDRQRAQLTALIDERRDVDEEGLVVWIRGRTSTNDAQGFYERFELPVMIQGSSGWDASTIFQMNIEDLRAGLERFWVAMQNYQSAD